MTLIGPSSARFATDVYVARLDRAIQQAALREIDAVLVTPSPDYGYLLGYTPPALKRLTCLVLPANAAPTLVVPRLEEPLARHELGDLADRVEVMSWEETDDPYRLVAGLLPGARRVAIEDHMPARFVLRL